MLVECFKTSFFMSSEFGAVVSWMSQSERDRQREILKRVLYEKAVCKGGMCREECAKYQTPLVTFSWALDDHPDSSRFTQISLVRPAGSKLQMETITTILRDISIGQRCVIE